MRGVAEVVAFAAMAIQVGERERSRRNRQRLLRRLCGPRLAFAGDDARDVVLELEANDAICGRWSWC